MKRNKTHTIIVGVKDHPMFVVLPYKTAGQRDKYFRELEGRGTISLPSDDEIKVLPLRYLAMATITHERNFSNYAVEKGVTTDVSTSGETKEG